MKRIFVLSMLICFAMICSCQKQDSAAEIQLAQQKADLDAREKELDERVNALDERVNALDKKVNAFAEKEKAALNAQTIPTDAQPQISDPAQVKTERDKAIQQVPAEIRTLIPHKAESDREKQERRPQTQRGPGQLQSQGQRKLKMFGAAVLPAAEASSPTPSSAVETSSPTPAPPTEATLPSASPTP